MKAQHLSLDQTADTYLPRGVDHLGFIEATQKIHHPGPWIYNDCALHLLCHT